MTKHAVVGTRVATLIGASEAATILGVSRFTVIRWAKAGKLVPFGEVGDKKVLLFDQATVERLAKERAAERAA